MCDTVCVCVCVPCVCVCVCGCGAQVRGSAKAITHFIDPRTGQEVSIDESAEHMRINLLDPKWKEQRQRNLVCVC